MNLVIVHSTKVPTVGQQCYYRHTKEEVVEMEIEVPLVLLVMVDIIPIDPVVDMVIPIMLQVVVMVVLHTIHPHETGLDSPSSSEFGRRCRHD